ncbi:MAG: hypothetical protein ACFNOL_00760 [Treponema maltophilum]
MSTKKLNYNKEDWNRKWEKEPAGSSWDTLEEKPTRKRTAVKTDSGESSASVKKSSSSVRTSARKTAGGTVSSGSGEKYAGIGSGMFAGSGTTRSGSADTESAGARASSAAFSGGSSFFGPPGGSDGSGTQSGAGGIGGGNKPPKKDKKRVLAVILIAAAVIALFSVTFIVASAVRGCRQKDGLNVLSSAERENTLTLVKRYIERGGIRPRDESARSIAHSKCRRCRGARFKRPNPCAQGRAKTERRSLK